MKLVRVAATLAAVCLGTLARGALANVSIYGSDGAKGDPFNQDAAQQLLGSLGSGLPADDAGLAVQQMLLTGEVKPASMKGLSSQIGGMVTRMTGEVLKSHNFNKVEIRTTLRIIDQCRGPRWKRSSGIWTRGITRLRRLATGAHKRVYKCRIRRNVYAKTVKACIAQVKALREARDALCQDYITTNKLALSTPQSCTVGATGETQHQWVKRMKAYIRRERITLLRHRRKCNKGERNLRGPSRRCDARKKKLAWKTKYCDVRLQAKLVESTCALKSGLKSMCTTYDSCYKSQVAMYHKIVNRTKQEVVTRKLQWRMLKRLECLVGAYDLKGGKIDKGKLDTCVAAGTYGTDHLNIAIPAVPAKVPCSTSVPATLATATGGTECKPTTPTTTTTRILQKYWSRCMGTYGVHNVCKAGYTQKGQQGVDPNFRRNRRRCCIRRDGRTGRCFAGGSGWKVSCELAGSPSSYLSGFCTPSRRSFKKQCKGGSIKSGGKKKNCRSRGPRGKWYKGYMAVCKVR